METLLQLGIDPWNMLLYLGNTGLLIALLSYFFYKPMLALIDKRREKIKSSIEEAEELKIAFEKKLAQAEEAKVTLEAKLNAEMNGLRRFVETEREKLTSEMEVAKSKMMAKAQEEIESKKSALVSEVEADLKRVITQIVLHIVENQVPEEVVQKSVVSAWKSYKK